MSVERVSVGQTVGALVVENFDRARVFDRYRINYCCHGSELPLADACVKTGANAAEVVRAIAAVDSPPAPADYAALALPALAAHIIEVYHQPLKEELVHLNSTFEHVCGHHGADHPELNEARGIFEIVSADLRSHMRIEETLLFPLCQQPELAADLSEVEIGPLLNRLHREDADLYLQLGKIRQLLDNYAVPAGACHRYQALLHGLARFEEEMGQHVHMEDDLLVPRLLETCQPVITG